MPPDRESAWKELLEHDAERFLAFFYADIHADLDWAHDLESLEQEFRKLAPEALTGKRVVGKLLRAAQKETGDSRFLHFEIQSFVEADFARRVYVYNSLAEQRFGQPIVSLPILIDEDPEWLPARYEAELYATRRILTFRTTKIIGLPMSKEDLEAHDNPVGLFVLAYLEGRECEGDHEAVLTEKARLIGVLSGRGLTEAEQNRWLIYFDWLLWLPPSYNSRLVQQLTTPERESTMSLVAYLKGLGVEEGHKEGIRKAIALGLDLKFGQDGVALMPQIEKIDDLATLQTITDAIKPASSLEDIRKLIPAPTGDPA